MAPLAPLPIDVLLPDVVAALDGARALVVEAPPGAGKTTRVPAAILEAAAGDVLVLEPRRLAARLAARRVAEERGERAGETVGYQVRFDEAVGPRTRLRFVTEGILTRRLLADRSLDGVGAVVLDEFHERHLQGDLALALLRRLQQTVRPDLRLVVMSATLDAGPVARFLGDCPRVRSEGRLHAVDVEHAARPDARPLAVQVEAAVRRLVDEGLDGDVLVFLPGAAEIRRAMGALTALAERAGLLVLALHGELPAAEQDRAVRPADRRKVILSTNVAETSITIEGVVAVVDSGLARIAGHAPWTGLPTLSVSRISRASAEQRAGRAGRTRPGRCLRLYSAQDFAARAAFEEPEVRRLDLAETVLELHAAGVADPGAFEWFEPPPEAALEAAQRLLGRLGAVDAAGAVTAVGRRMLALPAHPRLARLVVDGVDRGVGPAACLVAALAGERDIRSRERFLEGRADGGRAAGPSDLLDLAERFGEAAAARFDDAVSRRLGLDPHAVRSVERVRAQLTRLACRDRAAHADDEALLLSILAGFPDRIARRRASRGGAATLLLANGGSADLAPESVVRDAEFVVAVDAEQRRGADAGRPGRRGGEVLVRSASAVEPEWLLELYPEAISESREVRWNATDERVEVVGRLLYDGLVLDETRSPAAGEGDADRVLAEAALAAGVGAFFDGNEVDRYLARVAFAAESVPESGLAPLGDEDARDALAALCRGRSSFAELRDAARAGGVAALFAGRIDAARSRAVAAAAPETVSISGRRAVRVNYERGRPPWIASRLQDFFGMREGPRIASGRVPLVLHLLAPSNRPVQVTADLAGFWQRHYPQVRRELSRRYPRHKWPEDPLAAL